MKVIRKIIIKDPTGKTISLGEFAIMTAAQVLLKDNDGRGGYPTAKADFADGTLTLTLGNIKGVGISDIVQTRQSDIDGGTNEWEIQMTDGRTTRLLLRNGHGIIGPKGPQGDSVMIGQGDLPLAHVLGEDNTKAMSQKGVTDAVKGITERVITVYDGLQNGYNINNTPAYDYFDNWEAKYFGYEMSVSMRGKHIRVYPQEGKYVIIAFMKNEPNTRYRHAWYSKYEPGKIGTNLTADLVIDVIVPIDTEYIWIQTVRYGVDIHPEKIEFYTLLDEEKAQLENLTNQQETITENIIKSDLCGMVEVTEAPSENDTYNGYLTDSNTFNHGNTRLMWIPECFVKGNGELKITHTGSNAIRVLEFAYFPLGTNLINNNFDMSLLLRNTLCFKGHNPATPGELSLRLLKETRRICVFVGAISGQTLAPSDITDKITEVTLPVCDPIHIITEKAWRSETDDIYNMIRQALWVSNSASDGTPPRPALALLHFSDLHGSDWSSERLNEWADKLKDYYNDILCTGDVVVTRPLANVHGSAWWQNGGLAERSLFVVGNHDGASRKNTAYDQREGSSAWDGLGKEWDFDTYFAPFIAGLEVTMPVGYDDDTVDEHGEHVNPYYKSCFWYKDYPEQKIRLIGLDCMHRFDGIVVPETGREDMDGVIDPATGNERTNVVDDSSSDEDDTTVEDNDNSSSDETDTTINVNPETGQDDTTVDDDEDDDANDEETETGEQINYHEGFKHTTTEQEEWLVARLNETIDENNAAYGYSVIVCCHFGLDDVKGHNERWNDETHRWEYNQNVDGGAVMSFKTTDVANFHSMLYNPYEWATRDNLRNRVRNDDKNVAPYGYVKGNVNNFGNIIKKWMDDNENAKFVCWLAGHTHRDLMFYPTKFPDILNIVIDQAGDRKRWETGNRVVTSESNTCANFLVVDTKNGLLKIVRLGYSMNKHLNSHRYICYDYIRRKVVNEG